MNDETQRNNNFHNTWKYYSTIFNHIYSYDSQKHYLRNISGKNLYGWFFKILKQRIILEKYTGSSKMIFRIWNIKKRLHWIDPIPNLILHE